MANTPSFQDLLNSFADEVFVGRGEQLTLFESALEASQPPFLILNISGQGGVGKTTLLERYCQISKNNEVAYANVTEDHLEIPKILETFVTQLEKDGLDFDNFKERYKKYQELKEKVEADPKVPSGLMDFALRGIAKVGVKSLKRIPVAGDVADVFLTPESEEVIAEQASEFTKYIFQKFTNKDERVLLLNTDAELTRCFLEDITKSLKNKKAVLSFDTYEKTAESIEKWLIKLLLGEYGQFSSNILFVIAGRYSLGVNWTRFRKAIRQIELREFTDDEAKDYLVRSGITDEKLISQFIEISERLPVLLALLVSSPNQLPHDVSGDAVQRFLQGLSPEQQEAALISSLPRYFNSDILTSILGEEEGKKSFEWLSKAHFVRTAESGWVYHDVVRAMMLRYFRMRSGQQFTQTHILLEEYYKKQIINLGIDANNPKINEVSSELEAEKTYHFLCQSHSKNVEKIVKSYLAEFYKSITYFFENTNVKEMPSDFVLRGEIYSNSLSQLLEEISDFAATEQLNYFRDLAKLFRNGPNEFENDLFEKITNLDDLDNIEKGSIHLLSALSKMIKKEDNILIDVLPSVNKFIELNPALIVGYAIRGSFYKMDKRYELALIDLSKSIEIESNNSILYNERGLVYYEMKDYPNTLNDFSKAIELRPENGAYYYWRGMTYYDMKDYPNALIDFTKDVELRPEDGYNYYWRGMTYYDMNDYPNALIDFTKVIELQPKDEDNYYRRGLTYYDMNDYPNALIDFTKAVELDPKNGYNYYWRGLTYYDMNDYPNALTDFTKDIELRPENGYNYYWRGMTYHKMKDYANALNDFSKTIELDPKDGDNYYQRGMAYYDMNDYPNALIDFTKAIELDPKNGYNYYWRGMTYHKMQDYPNALTDFSKDIELRPENGYNYYWHGMTYYKMQDYPNALTDFSKDIELRPEFGYSYYRLAICNFAINKKQIYEENIAVAVQKFEVMEESEKDWEDKLIQAICYLANKQYQKAKNLYKAASHQCLKKESIEYGLKELKAFMELVGSNKELKNAEEMLNKILEKINKK